MRNTKAVGFRNVLVHDYATVDDTVVIEKLTDLGDLDSYVRAVTDFVAANDQQPADES